MVDQQSLASVDVMQYLHQIIDSELEAVGQVAEHIDHSFAEAARLIAQCQGKVIFTGVGKSGHIGEKLAATFASVGISSFFMHATEAVHGDLGMVTERDVVIAISNSGETAETLRVLPVLKVKRATLIAITGNNDSTLAQAADVALQVHVQREADDFNLAPTNSTTAVLVVGDALGLTASKLIGFDDYGFGLNHPGGALGKRLVEQGVLKEN
ncbi:KpsF/GutQ family sugar-phosphate isomerase [Bifidobacterium panos]|uniref:Isomerase n=1 Tax=Bifidobacterium panos TaxID=2675321 RepID=A0ABX1SVE0_9BIFI|nr:SIS domain-containing protein [Bifidobacterium sp. DSM 109963]NMN01803.1 isomerase [Bifidobacterium sp. DSM 109963]